MSQFDNTILLTGQEIACQTSIFGDTDVNTDTQLNQDLPEVEQELENLLDLPLSIPLDQVIDSIQQDSIIETAAYIQSFLVPGGGE